MEEEHIFYPIMLQNICDCSNKPSWSSRPNPEDRRNRKTDDQKINKIIRRPKKRKTVRPKVLTVQIYIQLQHNHQVNHFPGPHNDNSKEQLFLVTHRSTPYTLS